MFQKQFFVLPSTCFFLILDTACSAHSLPFNTSLPKKKQESESIIAYPLTRYWGRGGRRKLLLPSIDLCNVTDEVQNTAGITPLVVVPGNQLDKVVVEGDTSLGIEDGGVVVADHVGRDNVIFGVADDT